jgi:hypothetical protein
MFKWFFSDEAILPPSGKRLLPCVIEDLEDRRLLSASAATVSLHAKSKHHSVHVAHASKKAIAAAAKAAKAAALKAAAASAASTASASTTTTTTTTTGDDDTGSEFEHGRLQDTITFSQAPAKVKSGLDALATTDSLAAPTSTQTVDLGNSNGVETYTIVMTSTGTTSRLTVDQNGNAVTQPTQSTTTWAVLNGTGTGSNAAAAAEITKIAAAKGLTAPTDTTVIDVSTPVSGPVIYSVNLSSASSTTTSDTWYDRGSDITVDSNGNPSGNEVVPFSALPAAIQTGINNHLPAGATALATTSTQDVDVLTANGLTFYSTTFTSSGTQTTVTVNSSGAVVSLPSQSTVQFSTIPTAAQTELQTLATAAGVSGTIAATQNVKVYDEGNGTSVYAVTLSSTDSTTSQTYLVTVASDQAGNPTVPPQNHGGGCDGGGGGAGGFGGGGGHRRH